MAFGADMKASTRMALIFFALTLAGLVLGSVLSAIATASFMGGEGSIPENLGCAVGSWLLAPVVLTVGLPMSLLHYPWFGWPSLAGFGVWLAGAILAFRGRLRPAFLCGFAGATLWALMAVPVVKTISGV